MHNVMDGPRGHETLLAPTCGNARTVYRGHSNFVIPACLEPESSSIVISGKPLAPGSVSRLKHVAGTAGVTNANLLRAHLRSSTGFEGAEARASSNLFCPCGCFNDFKVLRIHGRQLRPSANFHILVFKPGRNRAPNQGELSRTPLFRRKPIPGLYRHMERLSLVEIAPQLFFSQTAEWLEDVDGKRTPFEKAQRF